MAMAWGISSLRASSAPTARSATGECAGDRCRSRAQLPRDQQRPAMANPIPFSRCRRPRARGQNGAASAGRGRAMGNRRRLLERYGARRRSPLLPSSYTTTRDTTTQSRPISSPWQESWTPSASVTRSCKGSTKSSESLWAIRHASAKHSNALERRSGSGTRARTVT
jgi:hypothetical protein